MILYFQNGYTNGGRHFEMNIQKQNHKTQFISWTQLTLLQILTLLCKFILQRLYFH